MSDPIDVPIVGERIVYTWAEDVANRLNSEIVLRLAASETTNTSTVSDITGLSFPVANGSEYMWNMTIFYSTITTSQLPGLGFRHPGGFAVGYFRYLFDVGTAVTNDTERIAEASANTDEMTTLATNDPAATVVSCQVWGWFTCTADGTFQFRKRLNGTPSGEGARIYVGSAGHVICPQ